MKKFFREADFWLISAMLCAVALAGQGDIQRGGTIADLIMAIAMAAYAPATMRTIIQWWLPKSIMLAAWGWDARSDAIAETAQGYIRLARNAHRSVFGGLAQRGAIGRDLRAAQQSMDRRGTGRQHGGSNPVARQAAGAKSADDDGGPDGEPPHSQQLYSYSSFAQILDCIVKTLRNKVSSGLFQKPIQTVFGPRFTQSHLAAVLTPTQPPAALPIPQKRGRPRIAPSMGSKGCAA